MLLRSLTAACILLAPLSQAGTLPLNIFLEQVRTQSPGWIGSEAATEGASLSAKEGDLYYVPKLNFKVSHQYDGRQVSGLLGGTQTTNDNVSLGVEKVFDFGLKSTLNYTIYNNAVTNVPASLSSFGSFSYVSSQTELDLEQPFWRNKMGKETRAMSVRDEAQSLQIRFNERLNTKKLLAQAESAYYRLAIARESVKLQSEVLDRATKILEWTTRRVQNHLSDKSDMLQAKAAYQLRKIDLEQTLNELRAASLAFNVLRNSSSEEVPEELSLASVVDFGSLTVPSRAQKTDDVLSAEQAERVTVANNETSLQKVEPDLSAFGSVAVNGLSSNYSTALSQDLTFNYPMYMVGVRFSMPLNFEEASDIRVGRLRQQFAAEANTREKKLESDQTWSDLVKKFAEVKGRLQLSESLVGAQKEKLDYEKYRFNLGRTTTYQVLTFEQDYAQALITRLRTQQEMVGYFAQMKIYAVENN